MEVKQIKLEEEMDVNVESEKEDFGVIDVNLTAKSKAVYELLEEGVYTFTYEGAKQKIGKEGEPFLIHRWVENETKKWVTETSSFAFSEKAKLWDIFKACGFDLKEGDSINLKDLIGKTCQLYIIKDGEYNKIKTHIPIKKQK